MKSHMMGSRWWYPSAPGTAAPAPDSFDYIYLHVKVGSLAGLGSAPPHHPGNPGGSQVSWEHEADLGN